MAAAFKNIAITGGGGALGSVILKGLVDAGFTVTALVRKAGKLSPEVAPKVKEVAVDFTSEASLTDALKGQDAVVSVVGVSGLGPQTLVINAAVAAGVKRFLPSEFGCDLRQPGVRTLPVFADKVKVEDILEAEAAKPGATLSYTLVSNNLFLDWGLQGGFLADAKNKKATVYNGGTTPVSFTRLSTIADAVVAVLRHPEETKNKQVLIHDGQIPQKELIAAVQEVTGGAAGWEVTNEETSAVVAKSFKALSEGVFEPWVFVGFIQEGAYNAANKPGYADRSWNKVLGLKEYSEGELKELVKDITKDILKG